MEGSKEFECRKCGRKEKATEPPECCGQRMEALPLEICTDASGPEHFRTTDSDEPCDDARGG